MFGRKLKSSIAVDNGRSTEFIRRKIYPDKTRCYECGEEGHLSYFCPSNALGDRHPPPKKERKRKKSNSDKKVFKRNICFFKLRSLFSSKLYSHIISSQSLILFT